MRTFLSIALILAVVGAFALYAVARMTPPTIVSIGQPVRQDDFLYTVVRVEQHKTSDGALYTVEIRVDNQAVRVDYHWSDDTAYVVDAAGHRYQHIAVPSALDESTTVTPGGIGVYALRFKLPGGARSPMLRYWNGIMMGDVFDGASYARAAIPLEPN